MSSSLRRKTFSESPCSARIFAFLLLGRPSRCSRNVPPGAAPGGPLANRTRFSPSIPGCTARNHSPETAGALVTDRSGIVMKFYINLYRVSIGSVTLHRRFTVVDSAASELTLRLPPFPMSDSRHLKRVPGLPTGVSDPSNLGIFVKSVQSLAAFVLIDSCPHRRSRQVLTCNMSFPTGSRSLKGMHLKFLETQKNHLRFLFS